MYATLPFFYLWAGYFRGCKDAEFIGNSHTVTFLSTDTVLLLTESVTHFQFHFALVLSAFII